MIKMGMMQSTVTEAVNNTPVQVTMTEPKSYKDWKEHTVYGCDFRPQLHDMYLTIKNLELEKYIANYSPDTGWNFATGDEINRISAGLDDNPHSGVTFGYCLKVMSDVFKNGWNPKYNGTMETNVPLST